MDSADRRRARAASWFAAALCTAWIVAILPELRVPFGHVMPRFGGAPHDWLESYVGAACRLGYGLGAFAWFMWALASGVIPESGFDPHFIPLDARSWMHDTTDWGLVLGAIVAAMLPVWLVWLVGRLFARRPPAAARTFDAVAALRTTAERSLGAPRSYFVLVAVGLAEWAIAHATGSYHLLSLRGFLATIVSWAVGIVATAASWGLALSIVDGRARSLRELVGGTSRLLRVAAAVALIWVVEVAGLVALVVPALVWLVATQFAPLVVVTEDRGALAALRRSAAITRGVRAKLAAVYFVSASVPMAIATGVSQLTGHWEEVVVAAGIVALPFLMVLDVVLYRSLVATAPSSVPLGFDPRRLDPSLMVAGAWSAMLVCTFLAEVVGGLVNPRPAWLMMPPLDGGGVQAPLSNWCAYSFHRRARECETALADNDPRTGPFGLRGFGFAGARCVPAMEIARPQPHDAAVTRALGALVSAFGPRAEVRRTASLDGLRFDVVVLDRSTPVLALDVADRRLTPGERDDMARRAMVVVPEYWIAEVHGNHDPLRPAMLWQWRSTDTGYAPAAGTGRNPDMLLRAGPGGALRIAVDDVLPPACDDRTSPSGRTGPAEDGLATAASDRGGPSAPAAQDGSIPMLHGCG